MGRDSPRVLLVDDDPDICLTLHDLLSADGYDIEVIGTGQGAIEAVVRHRFDAVILDLGLPDQDGLVVLDVIHGLDDRLPVVVLTAFTVTEKTVESLKRGSFAYLTKPYHRDELRAVLAQAVKVRALAATAEQTQAALHESEGRFRAVVQSAPQAIVCIDSQGVIMSWNHGAARLFGYEEHEIVGQPFARLMPSGDEAAYRRRLESFERDGDIELLQRPQEAIGLRQDGTPCPIELFVGTWRTTVGRCYGMIIRDIRERKRWEAQLLQQQIEQQVLLDLIPGMVWYKDCHNRIVRVNRRAAESIGKTVAEVQGASTFDLYPEMAQQYYQDDRAVIDSGQPKLGIVEQYPSASGERRWFRTHKVPYRDPSGRLLGVLVLSEDITERKAAEDALQESQALLAESQRLAHVGSWVLDLTCLDDLNRNPLRWSEETYRIFGYEPGEVPVTNDLFFDHVHPDDRAAIVQTVQHALKTSGIYEIEHRIRRRDGAERICHEWARVIRDGEGRPLRMLGSCQDITERHERTAQLRAKHHELRALAMQLTLAEQRERRRLAGELHDYLAQLLALSRLKLGQARESVVEAKVQDRLEELDEVLNECLTYARSLMTELAAPLLHECGLAEALKWLAAHMQRHGLDVDVDAESETPALSEAHAVLLYQSVRELFFNVVKHARTSQARLVMALDSSGELRVTVSDAGIGFDEKTLSASARATTQFGLLGIRERMEALGGRFELHAAPGHGTRATLVLPGIHHRLAEDAAPARTHSRGGSLRMESAPIRVLLVDDHTLMRQGLRSLLESDRQLQVVGEAADGVEAIHLAGAVKPDLIIMDIKMPKLDGIEATRRIKGRHPAITVIGLSFYDSSAMEDAMRAAGASFFIRKDAAADQLRQAITVLQNARDRELA